MTVIQILADYPVLTPHATSYRAEVLDFFGPNRGHPVVALFDTMFSSGFGFDAVPKAFVSMSHLPALELADEVSDEVIDRAGGRPRLERLASLSRAFAVETHFVDFYRAHGATYRTLVDSALPSVTDAVQQLVSYTGTSLPSARVVLSPLLHDGGFAMSGGTPATQAFIGPMGVAANGLPDFGDELRLGPLIWHEMAHTVVNPLTSRAKSAVDSAEITDEEFREQMRKQAYTDWSTIVSESIIRALEVRLASRVHGAEVGERVEENQVTRGFIHVPGLAQLLQSYEADRDTYPSLDRFFPRLLGVFTQAPPGEPARDSL
jgi:hypothetical protein